MRTYIVHKVRSSAPNRRETREPIERELNECPNRDYVNINMHNIPSVRTFNTPTVDHMYSTMTSEVFDNCRLITMIWTESHVSGNTSFGYYNKIVSYFQLPQDITIDGLIQCEPGDYIYNRLDTTPYRMNEEMFYRCRIIELENKLRELEEDKVIVTREELKEIHNGARDCHDKPIPIQYFDETIFELD